MLIGLTGGIGSGKSTVAKLFEKYDIPIIDSDRIAREVLEPGKKAWKQIVDYFGKEILLSDQTIDRKKLGKIIFNDVEKREKLNKITHPIIIAEIISRARRLEELNVLVIIDIPLLFESKREPLFDIIIVVYVNKSIQLKRLMIRDRIDENEALQKIESQISLDVKKEKADVVINNEKDLEDTEKQVELLLKKLKRKLD